jgi:2-polyprenyl-6-methoxyphenol hydroxylase-like FAD-dependent oxidoreductase
MLWITHALHKKRMTMKEKETPRVLIAGAGPTGLMLACQLALRDVPFRIIDKNEDHTTQSRALVVQARSVEIFGQMDLAQQALQLGEKARAVNVVVNGKRVLHMNVRDIGEGLTPYPYLLMIEQSKTEQLLNDFLTDRGHAVERQTALLDLTQNADAVTATIKHTNHQEEMLRVEWLVGADGAHSVVRHKLNIPFVGKTYQQSLFVLDCEASLHLPSDEMSIAFAESAFAGFFPLTNGRCRVIGTIPEACEGQDSISFGEVAQHFAQRLNMDVSLRNPEWISLYHSHHRAVSAFRQGRCFLAGDAAHIYSPVGAQGMNTGLQDVYNLAWKLALVSQGKASLSRAERFSQARSTERYRSGGFSQSGNQSADQPGTRGTFRFALGCQPGRHGSSIVSVGGNGP